jgi:glycosyltransferase involved in cell wall biosynthesis
MDNLIVAGIPWHVAHQYEIAKFPFIKQYDLLINPYRTWGTKSRPVPDKVNWVTHYEKNKYDFMIAHVDQQSIYNPDTGDRIHKGKLYLEAIEAFRQTNPNAPIVTINHMTPFHDKYDTHTVVKMIKEMTAGTHVIVNSNQAAEQWGFGTPILHGLDADDWLDLPKEPRVITVLSQAGMEKAYRRVFLTTVIRILAEQGVPFQWVGVDVRPQSFDEYREYIGRSLVFFFPAWQSPRPRARTEAMLSGACIVTTPYQDAHTLIEDGVTGFLTSNMDDSHENMIDNPQDTADLLYDLVINRPKEAALVGQRGKRWAQRNLTSEYFQDQWRDLLNKIL